MNECVFDTIFAFNTLFMALKLKLCCCYVTYTHVMVEEMLPQQICNILEKSYETFYHIIFLEVCPSYEITPMGFHIKKIPCVGKPSKNFLLMWEKELVAVQFSVD